MDDKKPRTTAEYRTWLRRELGVDISSRTRAHYGSVTAKIRSDFERSAFWTRFTRNARKFNDEYKLSFGYDLWQSFDAPVIETKAYESFLLKTFRRNVLENPQWPSEPDGGWILPHNWFTRINDAVRTMLVVKYLDGVDFAIERMSTISKALRNKWEASHEAREEGYYAAHFYVYRRFEVPRLDWDTERMICPIEIHVTTQLQELMRRLLHRYYEERRARIERPNVKWQWDYQSDEFVANYLGHILHYVEGMIMDVRRRQAATIP